MSKHVIELRQVALKKGRFRLNVPCWTVDAGRVVGVVGPNGAGKTSLLRLLPGLDTAASGVVSVLGADPVQQPEFVRSQLGYADDNIPVMEMPIGDLLWVHSGYYPSWDMAWVEKLLLLFKLPADMRPSKLSKGAATRLRLLLAMAFRPKVLVLDEPAIGLDIASRRQLFKFVLESAGTGTTVVISSHQLNDIERIADELLVLNNGQVLKAGSTESLVSEGQTLEEAMIGWGAAG